MDITIFICKESNSLIGSKPIENRFNCIHRSLSKHLLCNFGQEDIVCVCTVAGRDQWNV